MKTQVLILMMALGTLQASGMGKPTNLFAARKQLNSKVATAPATHSSQTTVWRIAREVKCQLTVFGLLAGTIDSFRRYID
ncbi:hypothetical protein GCM10023189_53440 [Nibrella saemangeumensis]|uniref:Secreted protein n=1 Tax=Nibrella saemangeumensis TaxID=1084526 RepID=A0ABP8NNK1_9BACT